VLGGVRPVSGVGQKRGVGKKKHQSEIKTGEDDKKKRAAELAKLKKDFDAEKTSLGKGLQACTASFP